MRCSATRIETPSVDMWRVEHRDLVCEAARGPGPHPSPGLPNDPVSKLVQKSSVDVDTLSMLRAGVFRLSRIERWRVRSPLALGR